MDNYVVPTFVALGSLSELTLDPGTAGGGAFGKGSMCADGASGLIGNRSANSDGTCSFVVPNVPGSGGNS